MNRAERRRLISKFAKQRVKDALRQAPGLSKTAKKGFKRFVRSYVTKWANEDLKLQPEKARDTIEACLKEPLVLKKSQTSLDISPPSEIEPSSPSASIPASE